MRWLPKLKEIEVRMSKRGDKKEVLIVYGDEQEHPGMYELDDGQLVSSEELVKLAAEYKKLVIVEYGLMT